MSVYVIAQLEFTDEARYRIYESRFMGVLTGSGGALVVADEAPQCLEGDRRPDKIVVMRFDDEAQARAFLDSPEYREIAKDRIAGARTASFLVRELSFD